jgi:hypothetical protein
MLIQVIDLLVSWGQYVGRGTVMEVWRLAPLYLMGWSLAREECSELRRFRDFDDRVVEDCDQHFIYLDICPS